MDPTNQNFSDILLEYPAPFGHVITYDISIYYTIISNCLLIGKKINFPIPFHNVICYPALNNSQPVTYHATQLIILYAATPEQALYQYLHELGHIWVRSFPQHLKWFSELLSCSFNYFFYPLNLYRLQNINSKVLSLDQCISNFISLKNDLSDKPYLVYTSSQPIDSMIYSYNQTSPDFDFICLLRKFIERDSDASLEPLVQEFLDLLLAQS